jgi:hypothetical protein
MNCICLPDASSETPNALLSFNSTFFAKSEPKLATASNAVELQLWRLTPAVTSFTFAASCCGPNMKDCGASMRMDVYTSEAWHSISVSDATAEPTLKLVVSGQVQVLLSALIEICKRLELSGACVMLLVRKLSDSAMLSMP